MEEKRYTVTLGTEELTRGSFLFKFSTYQVKKLDINKKTNLANSIKRGTAYNLINQYLPASKQRLSGVYFLVALEENQNYIEFCFDLINEGLENIITNNSKEYYKARVLKLEGKVYIDINKITRQESLKLRNYRESIDYTFELNKFVEISL